VATTAKTNADIVGTSFHLRIRTDLPPELDRRLLLLILRLRLIVRLCAPLGTPGLRILGQLSRLDPIGPELQRLGLAVQVQAGPIALNGLHLLASDC
jgi:hypothetical protein